MTYPSRQDPHNPLGACGLKILPILEYQWLTGRMQHSCPHEGLHRPWERAPFVIANGPEMTTIEVVVHNAERLHGGIHGCRPDKTEATPTQLT